MPVAMSLVRCPLCNEVIREQLCNLSQMLVVAVCKLGWQWSGSSEPSITNFMNLRQNVLSLHKQFGETACQELRQLGRADVAKELAAAIQQLAQGGQADAEALVTMVATCLLRSVAEALHLHSRFACRYVPERLPTPVFGGSRVLDGITQHGGRPTSSLSCAVPHWRKQRPASTRYSLGRAPLPCQAMA